MFFRCVVVFTLISHSLQTELRVSNGLNTGNWGTMQHCPPGEFARTFEVKFTYPGTSFDEKGITGLRLFCESPNTVELNDVITSSVSKYGTWTGEKSCHPGYWLTGYRLRVEKPPSLFSWAVDDTGVADLEMICTDGKVISGGGAEWGSWGNKALCPKGEVLCGVQTRIHDGTLGSAGMTDLFFTCCALPPPPSSAYFGDPGLDRNASREAIMEEPAVAAFEPLSLFVYISTALAILVLLTTIFVRYRTTKARDSVSPEGTAIGDPVPEVFSLKGLFKSFADIKGFLQKKTPQANMEPYRIEIKPYEKEDKLSYLYDRQDNLEKGKQLNYGQKDKE